MREENESRVARIRVFRQYSLHSSTVIKYNLQQATVMLNANVAFLAIQSVDVDADPRRSPAQVSSYLSVIANIGSIILGLLLMRQNRTKSRETADEAVSYLYLPFFFPICQRTQKRAFLQARHHPLLGLETLAILYSLPYALLMWGYVHLLYISNS